MKILHMSDTHGKFKEIPSYINLIIHSGDFCPDPPRLFDFNSNALWQEDWLKSNSSIFKELFSEIPFVFIRGNHDYISSSSFENIFRQAGINATCIENKSITIDNLNIYGFPWVNYINGRFNLELSKQNMKLACDNLKDYLNENYTDILVCHGPMTNGLSNEGFCDYGNTYLEDCLKSLNKNMLPSYMLVGHCHNAKGIKYKQDMDMLVVNSATTYHIIDV